MAISNNRIMKVRRAVERESKKALTASAMVVQGEAINLAPVKTGNLRGSIDFSIEDVIAIVGTNVEYAPYVEYGTYKMDAQPFLFPALINNRDNINQIMRQAFHSAIKGATR